MSFLDEASRLLPDGSSFSMAPGPYLTQQKKAAILSEEK